MKKNGSLRILPKVDSLLNDEKIQKHYLYCFNRELVVRTIQQSIETVRLWLKEAGREQTSEKPDIKNKALNLTCQKLDSYISTAYKKVVNATGIIIHTNLGRAPLAKEALGAVIQTAGGYSNLEFDLDAGARGSRHSHIENLLRLITNCEDGFVVNNNAAAVLLVLDTFAKDKEVVISRGELVEIGGSFRIPDILRKSGAILREVGTTNRTHLKDYTEAINVSTGLILKVHTSNYRMKGFTSSVDAKELLVFGSKHGIPVVEDLGSGCLVKIENSDEPTVKEVIASGIDIVTFSGDKLLGGAQGGFILGKKKFIEPMKKNPLTRALRIDKLTLAAIEATLKLYLTDKTAVEKIPVLKMLSEPYANLEKRAKSLSKKLETALKDKAEISVIKEYSQVGGGAMPEKNIPSPVVAISFLKIKVEKIEERLRNAKIPVIARIFNNRLLIDLRTVFDDETPLIIESILQAVNLSK